MKSKQRNKKIIISGGGTGGHIFPAIAIARALLKLDSQTNILFVGASGRMEMEKVPAAGFEIKGLPVSGFNRKLTINNIKVLINLLKSIRRAKSIISRFKPDVVVGTGGYVSGPVLYAANKKNIPTLIQEQNSYPGITNKLLAKGANKICVAYVGLEKYFPPEKILLTGNPIREDLEITSQNKSEGLSEFKLDPKKKTILILGGSLGARTINQAVEANILDLKSSDIQVLWQCGKLYHESAKESMEENGRPRNIVLCDFIFRMDLAYAVSDLVISRAGAGTISELCVTARPSILVPSPNVAEDHQTKNAMALVENDATLLIRDVEAEIKLIPAALELIENDNKLKIYSENIKKLAIHNSAELIANEVIKLCAI